jgi:hypothetical protein
VQPLVLPVVEQQLVLPLCAANPWLEAVFSA